MGSFVAIAIFADFVISTAVKGITDDYTSRFMRGTGASDRRRTVPQTAFGMAKNDRGARSKFAYKLDIVDRWTLNLPPKQAEKLDNGELAIDAQGDILYHRLKQTPQILVVGPISPERNPGVPARHAARPAHQSADLEPDWRLSGDCRLALGAPGLARPGSDAPDRTRLGEGLFEARAPTMRSSAFGPLAETLNGMAERIQRLIATQKELSSAISHELRTPIARLRFALEMLAAPKCRPSASACGA
jgi:signal transduction histidine kinase